MYLIVGLGNPTDQYAATRHNIGFDVITKISDDYNIVLGIKKQKAKYGRGIIEGQKVIIAQPQTYMNLSGESVRELVDYYHINIEEELIVIFDDISLDIGAIRIRTKGSSGGHNGIKSIIKHLGTENFQRIKVGVGAKPKDWDLADYVLSRFSREEDEIIREVLERTSKACALMITKGVSFAMNEYNKKESKH